MSRLAISPDGTLIGALRGNQLLVIEPASTASREVEVDGARSVAAADGELWVACQRDESTVLRRFDATGAEIDHELALSVRGPASELHFANRSIGPRGTVLLGAEPLSMQLNCGEVAHCAFRPEPSYARAIGTASWIFVRDGQIGLSTPDGTGPLPAAPRLPPGASVVTTAALSDGAVFGLFVSGDQPAIWLLDGRRGEVRRQIPCPQAHRVAFAEERGHALVLSGDGEWLTVLDLRFGKPLAEWRNKQALREIVVADGDHRVAALQSIEGDAEAIEVVWTDYRSVLRARKRLEWTTIASGVTPSEQPALAAEPHDPATTNGHAAAVSGGDGPTTTLPLATPSDARPVFLASPVTHAVVAADAAGGEPPENGAASFHREPPEHRPCKPLPSLVALAPVDLPPVASGELALRALERALALVASWTQRAIAMGWDSGRLAFAASDELPFEHEVAALLGGHGGRATAKLEAARAEVAALEAEHDQRLDEDRRACATGDAERAISPLAALAHEHDLSTTAIDILMIVAAPAIWGELARLYGICANDEDRPLCDEWLVMQILGSSRGGRRAIAAELDPGSTLLKSGLIRAGTGRRPFASLFPHPLVVRRLYGETFDDDEGDSWISGEGPTASYPDLIFADDHATAIAALARPQRDRVRLVVSGRSGSGRRCLIAALAAAAGRRVGWIDLRALSSQGSSLASVLGEALRRASLRGWLPAIVGADVLDGIDPSIARDVASTLAAFSGPLAVRCDADTRPMLEAGYLHFELAPLSEDARHLAWHRALEHASLSTKPAARFAALYRFGPGIIAKVVDRAVSARLPGDSVELASLLEDGIRQVRSSSAGNLATRVERMATWSQICLPAEVLDNVREFIGRVRHRRLVFDRWGFDRVVTSSRGLTALFEGRPGTGKTMVAGVIARELRCDLYRVDLSRVLSKWVGETERHLAEVFDAAEGGQMILLFDEADSLFSKRTEVKSSNDRFANIEVNYLLQRLDTFDGIAILTTNFGKSIDPAFKRRLSLRLTFPFPDEDLRAKLWKAHLPSELPIAGDLDLEHLARKYPLSGGYIRNIILRAAFLAAHEAQTLTQEHLERAISLEYRAMGKLSETGVLE